MTDLAPFIIIGLASGSIYSLAALGLVLTFKTSGVFNFAHGAVAATAAYVFYDLYLGHGLPWPVALLICLVTLGPILGAAMEGLSRHLTEIRPVYSIMATVGLLLGVQGFLSWKYGATAQNAPVFLPERSVQMFGVDVQYHQIITAALAAIAAAGLYVFLAKTRLGIAMRGVVDDRSLLELSGGNAVRTRRVAWMIGTSFAALSGILIAPTLGLDAVLLTLLVVQAFGATAVGGFSSLPLTYLGGLVIGVGSALTTKFVTGWPALSGLPFSIPFIVLFVALVLMSRRLVTVGPRVRTAPPARLPASMTWLGSGLLAMGVVAVPFVAEIRLPTYTNALILVLIFVSLALLIWTSGQISLCHAAFAAVGASAFSHLTTGLDLPWLVALVGAGLATVPLGAILALPATRLAGVYLALATFGFGVLVERSLFPLGIMFGKELGRSAPRPEFGIIHGDSDRAFYYVVLAVVVVCFALVVLLTRTRLGRLLRALGASPVGLATLGLRVNTTRVLVFCSSAFLAGVAGALLVAHAGTVAPASFGVFLSLLWITVLAVSGSRLVASPIIAAGLVAVLPAYMPDRYVSYQTMMFGALTVVVTVLAGRPWLARLSLGQRRREGGPSAASGLLQDVGTVAAPSLAVAAARREGR